MKTGGRSIYGELSHDFYVVLLGLKTILYRISFKDAVIFQAHNEGQQMDSNLFTSAVCFNLFSEWGMGKKLEPLLFDLCKDMELDYEKYKDDIFYEEIINLCGELSMSVYSEDAIYQNKTVLNYAISSLSKIDKLSRERILRLKHLFDLDDVPINESDEIENNEIDNEIENVPTIINESDEIDNELDNNEIDNNEIDNEIDNSEEKFVIDICKCGFCSEFRKYHIPREEDHESILIKVVKDIDRKACA